ncbi:MAG: hypothetical protein ACI3YQ_00590 [Prevotella sp.]
MNIIISTLIIILLFSIFITWLDNIGWKHKEELMEKAIDKASAFIGSKKKVAMGLKESGPWYLVVFTKDRNYPIWISNNTIRSVHPEPEHCKIIIKQFDGKDMVIENVEYYEMCAAKDLCDYGM